MRPPLSVQKHYFHGFGHGLGWTIFYYWPLRDGLKKVLEWREEQITTMASRYLIIRRVLFYGSPLLWWQIWCWRNYGRMCKNGQTDCIYLSTQADYAGLVEAYFHGGWRSGIRPTGGKNLVVLNERVLFSRFCFYTHSTQALEDKGVNQGFGTAKDSFFPGKGYSRGWRECSAPTLVTHKRFASMSVVLARGFLII